MSREQSTVNPRSVRRNRGPTGPAGKVLCLLLLVAMVLPGSLPLGLFSGARAQTEPPLTGIGDWVISDNTVMKDRSLVIQGNIEVKSGGSLTLDHTVLQFNVHATWQYTFIVDNGGALYIQNDSYLGTLDEVFILSAAPGSVLRITDSTVNGLGPITIGSTDAIIERDNFTLNYQWDGIVMLGGKAVIRNSTFVSGDVSIWDALGDLTVYDTTVTDSEDGILVVPVCTLYGAPEGFGNTPWIPGWFWAAPQLPPFNMPSYCGIWRTARLTNNHISYSYDAGIKGLYSTSIIDRNTFEGITGEAIQIENMSTFTTVLDNEIVNCWIGIDIDLYKFIKGNPFHDFGPPYINSNITIFNGNITKSKQYSFYVRQNAMFDGSWTFRDHPSLIDSVLQFRIPITVTEGGRLDLVNTSMELWGTGLKPYGLTVEDTGTLNILGVTTIKNKLGLGSYLQVLNGGTAHINGSHMSGWGYSWGTSGETAGLYSAGTLTVDNSTIDFGFDGIIVNGGRTEVHSTFLKNCSDGFRVLSGEIDVFKSNLTGMTGFDIKTGGGLIELYDTPFNTQRYVVSNGKLDMFWSCDLMAMWNNGVAIGNASFNISEVSGAKVQKGTTGPDGLSEMFYLREFTDTGTGISKTTPHSVSGTYIGMKNTTVADITQSTTIPLYIPDKGLPWLKVNRPGLQIFQRNNTLLLNGTAGDNESGLDRVQWSLDQDLWTDVDGLASWGLTMRLTFGSYTLYLRAIDRAGNVVNRTLFVTIDSTPPAIHILDPTNGFITKLRTVLVYGMTEVGANVTIKGQSITSTDGTFRLSVPIDEGSNLLVATVTDATGNTNSTTVLVIRDTTPPKIIITNTPENYITNKIQDQNLAVSGLTEPGATLMSEGRVITVNDDGTFSFLYGLKDGINEISLVAEDALGNQNSTVRHVIYDRTIPTLNVTSPEDGFYTNHLNVTVTGSTEASANVTVSSLNFTATSRADQEGMFSVTIGLSEGLNVLVIAAKDLAGNIKSRNIEVFRDTIAPTLILEGVTEGMSTEKSSLLVEGQTEVGARVKFNGNIINVGVTGLFSVTLDLYQANNTFVFESMDKAGNTKTVTLHVHRTVTAEPQPSGAGAALNYLPWLVVLAAIVLAVQWAFIAKSQKQKAMRKHKVGQVMETKETEEAPEEPSKAPPKRIEPRRPRQGAQVVVEHGAPEFEIEYGEGSQGPGGGRK